MKEKKDLIENQEVENSGTINISDDVVCIVTAQAVSGIEGVSGMTGGIAGGISELFGKKNNTKGVKVLVEDNKVSIDLYVTVQYGVKIPDVSRKIQERVKGEVESMTGLEVTSVNVNIEGVAIPKEQEVEVLESAE